MTHKGTQTIETSRLILRRAEPTDAQAMFHNWANDPEVTKFLTWPTHEAVAVTQMILESWVADYQKEDFYQWIIVPKDLGQPIGTISVVSHDDAAQTAELGYCIGKAWWHRGYTSEAAQAVICFLFSQVGLQRITARHDVSNPHSGGVMQKCGMQYTGTQPDRNNQGDCIAACYAIDKP